MVPQPTTKQKYCNLGMVHEDMLVRKGVEPTAAKTLATFANFGISQSTWSSYRTVENHLERCKADTGKDLCLPFNLEKTLTFVAWLLDVRKVKAITIEKYLSGLRMVHMAQGSDLPCLREPIVKLILTGRKNWDNIKEKLEGKKKRDPVTVDMMKFLKKKLVTIDWPPQKKILFHAVTTLAWHGSFCIHELLSRESKHFDPTVTLLWGDIQLDTIAPGGKNTGVMNIFLKSPKSDRIGAGQRVDVFESGNFMCPFKAFNKYKATIGTHVSDDEPVFRERNGECLTGKKLNSYLDEISLELKARGIIVKNHSFRAGVATLMAMLGYSDQAMPLWHILNYQGFTEPNLL